VKGTRKPSFDFAFIFINKKVWVKGTKKPSFGFAFFFYRQKVLMVLQQMQVVSILN
jgi:hypothetical protein